MAALALHGRSFGARRVSRPRGRTAVRRQILRQLMGLAATFIFVFGILFCGPAAHAAYDIEEPAAVQMVDGQMVHQAVQKVVADHQTPAKKTPANLCTGHCVAHTLSLPAGFDMVAAPFAHRALWTPQQDHLRIDARPDSLDRPPRA